MGAQRWERSRVMTREKKESYLLDAGLMKIVDGETYYTLKGGQIVEAE